MESQPPLDPRPNATQITGLMDLTTAEHTLNIPKITREDADSLGVSSNRAIIESVVDASEIMLALFCVGDSVLKVNETVPDDGAHFQQMMAELSPCSVVVSRRAFVTAPGQARLLKTLRALGLPALDGYSYQIVNCKKQELDSFLTTSFGFVVEEATVPAIICPVPTRKIVIGEINTNTAAEKYFAVGDALLDIKRYPIKPDECPGVLNQFNRIFQRGGNLDVLIERPASNDAIILTEGMIKDYLLRHDTPAMSADATIIGMTAARYHRLWRKMTAVSILVEPQPEAPPAPALVRLSKRIFKSINDGSKCLTKKKTTEDPIATEGTQGEGEDSNNRIAIESDTIHQEISTEVPDGTQLEPTSSIATMREQLAILKGFNSNKVDVEKENTDKEDESEKSSKERKKPVSRANPVVVPYVRDKKPDSKKKKSGLLSSLPFMRPKKQ